MGSTLDWEEELKSKHSKKYTGQYLNQNYVPQLTINVNILQSIEYLNVIHNGVLVSPTKFFKWIKLIKFLKNIGLYRSTIEKMQVKNVEI